MEVTIMKTKYNKIIAIITISALSSPVWAVGDALKIQQHANISYVTGGIGADESDALQATQNQYNLRVMNADKNGRFSGDTRILIRNLKRESLLDVTSGPLFYANLPKGKYIITGYSDEQSKEEVVNISNKQPARVRFVWPEDNNEQTSN
jgi:hypothetical protein